MFPTIYGIALGSLSHTDSTDNTESSETWNLKLETNSTEGDIKIGASGLIMAILGGALITPLQGMVSDATGSINTSYVVPLGCFIVVLCYALFAVRNEKILSNADSGR